MPHKHRNAMTATDYIRAAMAQLSKASEKLRVGIGTSPPEYYEVNRAWAHLDAMAKAMERQPAGEPPPMIHPRPVSDTPLGMVPGAICGSPDETSGERRRGGKLFERTPAMSDATTPDPREVPATAREIAHKAINGTFVGTMCMCEVAALTGLHSAFCTAATEAIEARDTQHAAALSHLQQERDEAVAIAKDGLRFADSCNGGYWPGGATIRAEATEWLARLRAFLARTSPTTGDTDGGADGT